MGPIDREDSSTYVNRPPQPEPLNQAQATPPPAPRKPRRSKVPLVLSFLLVLALLAAAVLGWLWYQKSEEVDNVRVDLSSMRGKVSQLESTVKTQQELTAKATADESDMAKSDSEALIEAVKANIDAQVNSDSSKAKIEIMKLEGDFASVNVSGPSAEVGCVYKKSNDMWLKLYCAQNETDETKMWNETYGVPMSLTRP